MLLVATAENGTNGSSVIAGNEFDIVNVVSGSTHNYTASGAINGAMGYVSVSGTAGGGGNVGWSTALGTKTEVWMRMYATVPVLYPGSLCQLRFSGATAGRFSITAGGKLQLLDGAGASVGFSTTNVPVNTPFRVETHAIASASPTGGTLEYRIYTNPNSTTVTETMGPFTANQTAAGFDQVWFGPFGSGVAGSTLYHDDDTVSDTGWIGPPTAGGSASGSDDSGVCLGVSDCGRGGGDERAEQVGRRVVGLDVVNPVRGSERTGTDLANNCPTELLGGAEVGHSAGVDGFDPVGGRMKVIGGVFRNPGFPTLDGWTCFRIPNSHFRTDGYATTVDVRATAGGTRKTAYAYSGTWPPTQAQLTTAGVAPATHYLVRES